MDSILRKSFNEGFSEEAYQSLLKNLDTLYPGALDFRVAETPLFIPKSFTHQMLDACEDILDVICKPNFKSLTNRSIPADSNIPGESENPEFMVFDFGVCSNQSGSLEPQLIEMQGFPSLFAYQADLSRLAKPYANIPDRYSSYLNGYDEHTHKLLLKEIILGNYTQDEVILLEIYPEKQKTRIDFFSTAALLGIKTICYTKLKSNGRELYYEDNGNHYPIKRIYNRMIFDDLHQQEIPDSVVDLKQSYDVEWVTHPNWFYRVSKFTLPFIDHPFIPETYFLNELKEPVNLDLFVLKPLFSFAGMGVIIDVQQEDIDKITDPENWILQRKVTYAPVIETMDEPAKAEIRLFYYWKKGWDRPKAIHNLSRLSKGKMVGTRYNKDKTWVGGTIAFFEKD